MILKLRNRHRHIWMVLAPLLPVCFVLALASRPGAVLPEEKLIEASSANEGRQPLASAAGEGWDAEIYRVPDGRAWLEVKFTAASRRPASTLCLAPRAGTPPAQAAAVGAVGSRGIYQYPLDSLADAWQEFHLFFYDQLRKQVYFETQLTKSR